jgi:DNA gyrase inhibitor GyrI
MIRASPEKKVFHISHKEKAMEKLEVRIVTLPAMRVVCFNGFGPSPEDQAFDKLIAWAKEKNIWDKPHRLFGYNNPDPSPGSPNYGYDAWMTVDESVQTDGEARIIDFPGGLYAVTTVHAGPKGEGIFETWQELAAWVEHSQYRPEYCRRVCLEESLPVKARIEGGFTLDLYEPITVD